MIISGIRIELRAYKTFKGHPEDDVPIGYGEDKLYGKHLQFQVMDHNRTKTSKNAKGFAYVNIYTNQKLDIGDTVTVDKILYIQIKQSGNNKIVVIGMTIEEKGVEEVKIEKFRPEDINDISVFEGIEVDF